MVIAQYHVQLFTKPGIICNNRVGALIGITVRAPSIVLVTISVQCASAGEMMIQVNIKNDLINFQGRKFKSRILVSYEHL